MINQSIVKAILSSANNESKEKVIKELLNHIDLTYDYNNNKAGHILEMLVDNNAIITFKSIDTKFIEENFSKFIYKYDDYIIKNIKVTNIDNIDCVVKVEFERVSKVNEFRDDISYETTYININFIDNPDILKK